MKNDVYVIERGCDCIAIAQITFDELRLFINSWWLSSPVRLRLEIIKRAHLPAFAHEEIDNVRTNQARSAGD
jgi:hypothetical protein